MALTTDSSTPAVVVGASGAITTIKSNAFEPPANALLVITVQNTVSTNQVTSITDSLGSHLTYEKLTGETGQETSTQIWVARTGATMIGSAKENESMTVTASISATEGLKVGMSIVVVSGAAVTQNGA